MPHPSVPKAPPSTASLTAADAAVKSPAATRAPRAARPTASLMVAEYERYIGYSIRQDTSSNPLYAPMTAHAR